MATTKAYELGQLGNSLSVDSAGSIEITGTLTASYAGFDSDFTTKSTSDLSEGSNLYYTTARFDSDFSTGGTFTSNVTFNDNVKAIFGDSSDLQIYHDGSHSYIKDVGYGNFLIRTNGTKVALQDGSGNNMVQARPGGAVQLHYDAGTYASPKLETTSTGIDVAGEVTADSATIPIMSGDITFTGNLQGPSTWYIDPAPVDSDAGLLVIRGDLQVDGTTTTVNSTTVEVGDKNIVLGADATANSQNDGGGITVLRPTSTNAVLSWDETIGQWEFSHKVASTQFRNNGTTGSELVILNDKSGGIGYYADNNGHTFKTYVSGWQTRLVIQEGGWVGIGTDTPSRILTIRNTGGAFSSNNNPAIRLDNTSTGRFGLWEIDSDQNMNIWNGDTGSGNIRFYRGGGVGTHVMTIGGNGAVGIGTTAPLSYGSGVSTIHLQGTADNSRAGAIRFHEYDGTLTGAIYSTDGTDGYGGITLHSAQGPMKFSVGTLQSYRMTLDSDGYVGINTTDPAERLHVAGNIRVNNAQEFRSVDTGGSTRTIMRINSSNQLEYGWSGSGPVKFMGGGSYTERMRIHTDGSVGIGTDSTSAKLHVMNDGGTKTVLVERAVGSNAANLDEFSSFYSLSIKNRSDGSYLNFGGNSTRTDIQATDGAVSASSKAIHLNPFGGGVSIGLGANTISSGVKLEVEGSNSGNWISIIKNTHNSNGNGLKVLAGDNADTTSFRVSTYDNTTLFDVRSDGEVTAKRAYNTDLVRHSTSPSLNLDFAKSKELDPRITFYRDSIATYYDSKGVLRYATSNEPRFDHNPATGESKGLLIEEERENLNSVSAIFGTGAYTASNAIKYIHNAVAPDGTQSAVKVVAVKDQTTPKGMVRNIGCSTNTTYTSSSYVKMAGYRYLTFWVDSGSGYGRHVQIDGTDGTVTNTYTSSGGVFDSDYFDHSVTDVGNGWYRISITYRTLSITTINHRWYSADTSGSADFGNGSLSSNASGEDGLLVWGVQMEQAGFATSYIPSDVKFSSRACTATYHDETGILRTAPVNTPRYGYKYDGRKWVETGLIIEGTSTSYARYTEAVEDWGKARTTIVENHTTAPNGAVNADKVVEDTQTGEHAVIGYADVTAGTWTLSVYAKANERTVLGLQMYRSGGEITGNPIAWFNLANGNINSKSSGVVAATSEFVGNGWYRVSITGVVTASTTANCWMYLTDGTGDSAGYNVYTGNGTSGLYVWGIQVEQTSAPSSYIPVLDSSAVTRNGDGASYSTYTRERDYAESYNVDDLMPDVNQSNIDFTLYGDIQGIAHNGGFQQALYFEDTSDAGNMYATLFSAYAGNNTISSSYNINGVSRNFGNWTSTESDIANRWKIAMGIKENDSRAAANGTLGSSAAGYWNGGGTFDRFYIGNGYQGGRYFNGYIRKIAYYDQRLSNDELTALTENN